MAIIALFLFFVFYLDFRRGVEQFILDVVPIILAPVALIIKLAKRFMNGR